MIHVTDGMDEDQISARVRRSLLAPLRRRKKRAQGPNILMSAFERLHDRALGESVLAELRKVLQLARGKRSGLFDGDAKSTRRSIALARALYDSRRISKQEYVFLATSPVESLNDTNTIDGDLASKLLPISNAMQALEEKHDSVWLRGEGPKEYWELGKKYDDIVEWGFVQRLRSFGLHELADLRKSNIAEFDRLRERGRRSVFHKQEYVHALRDIIVRYEEDARRAAMAKAFSAAITLLGAAIEGMLILRCLRSRKKALRIAKDAPRRVKPASAHAKDPMNWRFETLIEVCLRAGWLPPIATSSLRMNSAALANALRLMRNHVHPGKSAREKPWIEMDERDFQDAEAIYHVLFSTLTGKLRSVIS